MSPSFTIFSKYYSNELLKASPSKIFYHSYSVTYSRIALPIVPASNNS
jgi:hypothetical protein